MSIIKRNHDLFPAFFNDLFTRDLWNWGLENNSNTGTTIPSVNIKETNEEFLVEMAVPGMRKEDFNITLDGNLLTISSQRENESEEKQDEKFIRREYSYESFTRSFQLSKGVVDENKIQAKYENGVLKLVIPKKEEAKQKPRKMIQIS